MSKLRNQRGTRSFTLLEIIISVVVSALILGAAVITSTQVLNIWKVNRDKTESARQATLVTEWLVRDIQNSYSLFEATNTSLQLQTLDYGYVRYNFENNTLWRNTSSQSIYQPVSENITAFTLRYYNALNVEIVNPQASDFSNIRTIGVDITTQKSGTSQSFRLNTAGRLASDSHNTLWAKAYGGANDDGLHFLHQNTDGSYIFGGETNSFGAGGDDFFVMKSDASGNVGAAFTGTWVRTYGGAGGDYLYTVEQTTDGGYIFGGESSSFGFVDYHFFAVRTNSSGGLIWSKIYKGANNTVGQHDAMGLALQTADGGHILAGDSTSFAGAGSADFLAVKTDSNGNLSWARTYGGALYDTMISVQQATDGGYIFGGHTSSFGAGSGTENCYVVKTNAAGNTGATFQGTWSRTYGGNSKDSLQHLERTFDGGYILGGYTSSFGAGSSDFFLVKISSDGTLAWAKTYGGALEDRAYSVKQANDGGYILGGYTSSFGAGGMDYLVIKSDSVGNVGAAFPGTWAKAYGSTQDDNLWSLDTGSRGGYILGGDSKSFGAGNQDALVVKIDANGEVAGCGMATDVIQALAVGSPTVSVGTPVTSMTTPVVTVVTPVPTVTTPAFTSSIVCPEHD